MKNGAVDIDTLIEVLKRREGRAIAKFKPIYRKRIAELQKLKSHCPLPEMDLVEENDYLQLH